MTPHGTHSRYTDGRCRCDLCRAAAVLGTKKSKVRRHRNGGPLLISAGPAAQQIKDLRKTMEWGEMARLTGHAPRVLDRIPYRTQVHVNTARAIDQLWQDICAPVPKDTRRYPAAPLHQAITARYGSLQAAGPAARRRLHTLAHTGLSSKQTSQWAAHLGITEYDLWPDWGQPQPEQGETA